MKLDRETIELFGAHRKRQIEERLSMGSAWTETGYVFVQENGLPLDTTGRQPRCFRKSVGEQNSDPPASTTYATYTQRNSCAWVNRSMWSPTDWDTETQW